MKGLIFSELIRFMEEQQDPLFVERVIAAAKLPNDAAFSRIGVYPTAHALLLVGEASKLSGIPVAALCEAFGSYLFGRFTILYPEIMSSYSTAESLLEHVRGHIHEDVKVLYPDATPPEVTATTQDGDCVVEYRSHRPLAHIACGLIRGCLEHFGDERKIEWVNCSESGDAATFRIAS
ncbi:heme NO-binding domain-containing protein [Pseudoblastomonas halimionae]|uniref:heme NO-binding domain-containing protein n=1 Tax=Alteriqipengyuania halimionae TaxID=1926630 RepID=UPI002D7EBCC6|nr:heme NO-binding domain-containing protein [Alteriqipengyuania halimionae]